MSKRRLQVILTEEEYREIERVARSQRMTVSAWVRRSLRRAGRTEPGVAADRKLASVRAAARYEFPTADIGQMLAEIEQGTLGGSG
jgi:tRNA U38,U39,U40 pseudouridine synthase TruA